jgi:hypothetical protein
VAKRTSRSKNADISVFTMLDHIRERPQMWAPTLHDLEQQIDGYYAALALHRIDEPGPSMGNRCFLPWFEYRTGRRCESGWAIPLETQIPDIKEQFAAFFTYVDEYRKLIPTLLYTVRLNKSHQPTGKRAGASVAHGKMKKPSRVDIVQYAPEPLHFLEFHFPNRIGYPRFLTKKDLSYETTVRDAMEWCRDELLIKRHEWKKVR